MKVACQNCGAPLEVERGNAFAQCGYCGHANKVKSARTLIAEQPRPAPPPPVAAPRPVRAPVARRPTPRRFNIAGCLPVIMLLGGLSVAGFNVLDATGVWDRVTAFVSPESREPTLGTLDLDQPMGGPLRGIASGEREMRSLSQGCSGYIPRSPHVRLQTAAAGIVQLDVADTNVDLVMAVHLADGTWRCDDDGGSGTLPRLQVPLTAGEHLVYVGTFSQNATSAFTLRTTWQNVDAPTLSNGIAPDATPSLAALTLAPNEPPSGIWVGTSAGSVEARTLGRGCRGSVPVVPHLRVSATGGQAVRLVTRDATTDLTMIVRSPSGQFYCDDDSGGGLNPRIDTVLEAGDTAVWVGVFNERESAEFTLELSEEGGRVGSHGIRPDALPVLGSTNLDITPTPDPVSGTVRLELDARELDPSCRGWVGDAPDLTVITTIPRAVSLTAEGRADLTLLVRGPDGRLRCDDDSAGGRLPRLNETLTPGVTEVWVGQIGRRSPSAFTLSVSPIGAP